MKAAEIGLDLRLRHEAIIRLLVSSYLNFQFSKCAMELTVFN